MEWDLFRNHYQKLESVCLSNFCLLSWFVRHKFSRRHNLASTNAVQLFRSSDKYVFFGKNLINLSWCVWILYVCDRFVCLLVDMYWVPLMTRSSGVHECYVRFSRFRLFWIIIRFWEAAHLPLPKASINTYFSLRAKCWLREGVGGLFPGNVFSLSPLPKILCSWLFSLLGW